MPNHLHSLHARFKMNFSISIETDIDAPPATVWSELTNFASYAQWNPFINSMSGTPAIGEKLDVNIQPPGGSEMRFNPTVTVADEAKTLEWLGRVGIPFIFDGRHRFELVPTPSGGTRFVHGEKFSGILVPFFKRELDTKTKQGFVSMNEALKKRCERQ